MLCNKLFLLADVKKNLLFLGVQLLEFVRWLVGASSDVELADAEKYCC